VGKERREREVVQDELDSLLASMETRTSSSAEIEKARCLRDLVTLKKKNQHLLARLEEQREHYEDLGAKAARRVSHAHFVAKKKKKP
jgi:hypothetical protein